MTNVKIDYDVTSVIINEINIIIYGTQLQFDQKITTVD